ncbi:MAG TPA: sterol desaturase family protein [Thermoanaerobaculia bacterium]|nr:sterol desaturase family protein [Thermoanaerobaculia bacterium]
MGVVIALVVLSLFFGLLERWFGALPPRSIWRRARRIDFLYWFFTPLVTRAISAVLAGATFLLLARVTGRGFGSSWFASQPLALQWIEVLIGGDLTGYLTHRLFHRRPLWRFHAIHHSSESLDWLAAARVHPLNEAISRVLQLIPFFLLGFDPRVVAAAIPFLTFYTIFLHANLRWDFGPLRTVIASPRFHRWHHTSEEEGLDRNFAGLFPWIDILFGTFYMPVQREPQRFGLHHEPIPTTFVAQLAYPFQRAR